LTGSGSGGSSPSAGGSATGKGTGARGWASPPATEAPAANGVRSTVHVASFVSPRWTVMTSGLLTSWVTSAAPGSRSKDASTPSKTTDPSSEGTAGSNEVGASSPGKRNSTRTGSGGEGSGGSSPSGTSGGGESATRRVRDCAGGSGGGGDQTASAGCAKSGTLDRRWDGGKSTRDAHLDRDGEGERRRRLGVGNLVLIRLRVRGGLVLVGHRARRSVEARARRVRSARSARLGTRLRGEEKVNEPG